MSGLPMSGLPDGRQMGRVKHKGLVRHATQHIDGEACTLARSWQHHAVHDLLLRAADQLTQGCGGAHTYRSRLTRTATAVTMSATTAGERRIPTTAAVDRVVMRRWATTSNASQARLNSPKPAIRVPVTPPKASRATARSNTTVAARVVRRQASRVRSTWRPALGSALPAAPGGVMPGDVGA